MLTTAAVLHKIKACPLLLFSIEIRQMQAGFKKGKKNGVDLQLDCKYMVVAEPEIITFKSYNSIVNRTTFSFIRIYNLIANGKYIRFQHTYHVFAIGPEFQLLAA